MYNFLKERREKLVKRKDGRQPDELRKFSIEIDFLKYPLGSVLVQMGDTKVICTAMVEEKVPQFLRNTNMGWITAEYSLLPGSTYPRTMRDIDKGRIEGRSQEIQRIIGRTLRTCVDLKGIPGMTVWIDTDVIQADGGTRTAAINGGFVALYLALSRMFKRGKIPYFPIRYFIGAVSVGIVSDEILLDLNFSEDFEAQVDMNIVMNEQKKIIEIQGTGEKREFSVEELFKLVKFAWKGINEIINYEKELLKNTISGY
ncbi:MAG: ribonuclease PH [Caldiserica bacterium]|nr:MAG: ribonuclease PH [Caldisericota bacterium]